MKRLNLFCVLLLVSLIAVPSAAPVHSQVDPVWPHQVKDINTCTESSTPWLLAQTDNAVFLAASQASIGVGLWRSDGTESGTVRIKTFNPATNLRLYGANIWINGSFLFLVTTNPNTYSLWASDSTEAGTRWIKDISPAIDYAMTSSPVLLDGAMYIVFWKPSLDNGRAELWRSDGTSDGTSLVTAFQIGQYGHFSHLVVYHGYLYFPGWDAEHGTELWRSDGTASGTGLFMELNPAYNGSPDNLFVSGDAFYFLAQHESGRWLLWKSDGTQPGTQPILTEGYWPVRGKYAVLNNILYFPAENASGELRLWRTDGTSEGTWVLKDVTIETPQPGKFWNGVGTAGGSLYFAANQTELWKSDGTEAGTRLVKNLYTGNSTFTPSSFLDVGGVLYFGADDWGERPVLWRSDGTSAGTNMVDTGQILNRLPYLDAGPWRIQDNQVLFGGYAPCLGGEL